MITERDIESARSKWWSTTFSSAAAHEAAHKKYQSILEQADAEIRSELVSMLKAGRVPLGARCTLGALGYALHRFAFDRVHRCLHTLPVKVIGYCGGSELFGLEGEA